MGEGLSVLAVGAHAFVIALDYSAQKFSVPRTAAALRRLTVTHTR